MPAVTSGKVLVTGANGFVATWLIDRLLKQGYSVRAAVRSAGKGVHLQKTFATYGNKLEIFIVEDITADGAFDEAVKGVDAIEHVASPVHLNAVEPEEVSVPAVKGTTGVLRSALAHGSSVKRIVYTSSCGAVLEWLTEPKLFTPDDWNEAAVKDCQANGKNATPSHKYCASKVLAERAAWEFYEKNKANVAWDLVVLNPPHVFGPVLHDVTTPETLNASMLEWYQTVFEGTKSDKELADVGHCWIDVRDVADAHVKAIQVPEAGGERIIISEGTFKWQDWVNCARSISKKAVEGNTTYDAATTTHLIRYDTSKMQRILGLHLHSKIETTRDVVADYEARGWLN